MKLPFIIIKRSTYKTMKFRIEVYEEEERQRVDLKIRDIELSLKKQLEKE